MNKWIGLGRITKDLELKRTNSDIPFCQFSLAVNRAYQSRSGEKQVDYITCVAWRKPAELLAQYIKKGNQIAVEGSLQTRSYDDKNGTRHFITEVIVSNLYFVDNKQQIENRNNQQHSQEPDISPSDFDHSEDYDVSSDDLPF